MNQPFPLPPKGLPCKRILTIKNKNQDQSPALSIPSTNFMGTSPITIIYVIFIKHILELAKKKSKNFYFHYSGAKNEIYVTLDTR